MDHIELDVLKWFGELLQTWEEALFCAEALPEAEENRRLKQLLKTLGGGGLFITRHYLQALKMRRAALEARNFVWYLSATYALTHDLGRVRDSVRWLEWGGSEVLADTPAQSAIVLVCARGSVPIELAHKAAAIFARGQEIETFERVKELGFLREKAGRYYPGSKRLEPELST